MKVHPVYGSQGVLDFTRQAADNLIKLGIEGDFVECGVAAGSQIGAMQEACMANKQMRRIWGFDSFQGIPYAGIEDDCQPGLGAKDMAKEGVLETTGVSSHSKANVLNSFKCWDLPTGNLHLVEGWFQNTVPGNTIDKIALLRLDGDLYESTKVCMKYLFPKLANGGVLIIDDYGLKGCKKAVLEFIPEASLKIFEYTAYYGNYNHAK